MTGLHRTGDSTAPTVVREWMVKEMYRHGLGSATLGTQALQPEQMLADSRICHRHGDRATFHRAPARVTRWISAFRPCPIPIPPPALADGVLYRTDLRINGTERSGRRGERVRQSPGKHFRQPRLRAEHLSTQPAVRQSLRSGTIPGGGVVTTDRPIILQVRTPSWAGTRSIQERINQYYK